MAVSGASLPRGAMVDLWSVIVAFPGHTHLLLCPIQFGNSAVVLDKQF